jgi:hypothetical protein
LNATKLLKKIIVGTASCGKRDKYPSVILPFLFFFRGTTSSQIFDAHTTNRFRCTLWYDPSKAPRQKALLIMATINTSQKTLITVDVAFFNAWFAVVVRLVKTVA